MVLPVEMETEVSLNFHLKSTEDAGPPLGTFREGTYSNDFLEFSYPLSRDWVRETQLMRSRVTHEWTNHLACTFSLPLYTFPSKLPRSKRIRRFGRRRSTALN